MSTILAAISSALQARANIDRLPDPTQSQSEWFVRHADRIEALVKEYMPSGSGFDRGTSFNFDESRPERLVFDTAFHHMDENGYYDGWTEHKVIVTPSFIGFDMRVTGVNRRGIKEHISDTFHHAIDLAHNVSDTY